jgi:hypothetical protein
MVGFAFAQPTLQTDIQETCMRSNAAAPLTIAAAILCVIVGSAHASSCRRNIIVQIRIPKGASCWQHVGVGTTFKGRFLAGQKVTATAVGNEGDPASDDNRWGLDLTGPNGFSTSSGDRGTLNVTLRESGEYSFSTFPCAIWGGKGIVKICAK